MGRVKMNRPNGMPSVVRTTHWFWPSQISVQMQKDTCFEPELGPYYDTTMGKVVSRSVFIPVHEVQHCAWHNVRAATRATEITRDNQEIQSDLSANCVLCAQLLLGERSARIGKLALVNSRLDYHGLGGLISTHVLLTAYGFSHLS